MISNLKNNNLMLLKFTREEHVLVRKSDIKHMNYSSKCKPNSGSTSMKRIGKH